MVEPDELLELYRRIREELLAHRLADVARATGLHENTVRGIATGRNDNPTLSTLLILSAHLFPIED